VIAIWMLYCLGIGLAFVIVGHALERALHFAGRATRWAWLVALVGSYLIPVVAWLRPEAFATFAVPLSMTRQSSPDAALLTTPTISTILHQPPSPSFSLTDLDAPLRLGWGLASLAMLVTLGVAATRLIRLRRHWRRTALDGRQVFVSRDIGPAVVGVWRPRVVLPEWALALPAGERELMLAHEEEHVRAGDPVLLAAALVAWLVAPWNPALWWQWRRLRLAVEMDCDARVLAQGRSAPAYAELLLEVGGRRTGSLVGAAAFGEPVSFLESRIRRIIGRLPRRRWAWVIGALVVAAGAVVAACETPRPVDPQRGYTEPPASETGITGVVSAVMEPAGDYQAPALLSGPTLSLPDLLRAAGIEGRVLVQVRINADGRVQPGSVMVLQSPHPALAEAAKNAVSRSLFRPARAHGQAVAALVHLVYDFVGASSTAERARQLTDRLAVGEAERLRPWVETNARRMFPSILEPNGPPMNAFLIHDSRLHVYRGSLTTLDYLGPEGNRPDNEIELAELQRALPSFRPGHDGWGVVDPRGLRGLVRDNVRVIRINHDPETQDTAAWSNGLSMQEMNRRAEQLRRLARQYHPEMMGRSGSPSAIALVLNSHEQVVAHAASADEPVGRVSCIDALTRLVPQYKNAQWSHTGCAIEEQSNLIVYWGELLKP
jgi:TonB family protein